MHGRLTFAAITAAFLLAGCTAPYQIDPGDIEEGEFERLGCGDYVNGCGLGECPVKLTADFDTRTAVEVAGTINPTLFRLVGLERRWDWGDDGDGGYPYAVTIETDGTGQYYDFSTVMADADGGYRTKPSALFKRHRLRR